MEIKHLKFRKSKSEQFIDLVGDIAKALVGIILGIIYLVLKFTAVNLNRFKKGIFKTAVYISVLYFLFGNFTLFTEAPKTASALSHSFVSYPIPSLNPNVDQREQVKSLIQQVWGKDAWIGENIARCESGYNPNSLNHNTNGTWDQGVFQVNTIHQMPEMMNMVANISYAYTLYLKQGTNPWNASRSCWSVYVK